MERDAGQHGQVEYLVRADDAATSTGHPRKSVAAPIV